MAEQKAPPIGSYEIYDRACGCAVEIVYRAQPAGVHSLGHQYWAPRVHRAFFQRALWCSDPHPELEGTFREFADNVSHRRDKQGGTDQGEVPSSFS